MTRVMDRLYRPSGMSKIPTSWDSCRDCPIRGPVVCDFFPAGMGTGMGARITLPAPLGLRIYEKTILPLVDIYYIYTYLYFYVISPIFI